MYIDSDCELSRPRECAVDGMALSARQEDQRKILPGVGGMFTLWCDGIIQKCLLW